MCGKKLLQECPVPTHLLVHVQILAEFGHVEFVEFYQLWCLGGLLTIECLDYETSRCMQQILQELPVRVRHSVVNTA